MTEPPSEQPMWFDMYSAFAHPDKCHGEFLETHKFLVLKYSYSDKVIL